MKGWTFLRSAAVRYPWAEQRELLDGGAEETGKEEAGVNSSRIAAEEGEKFATLSFFEVLFSVLHEKLNFVMGRTRLPKLLSQCLVFKHKIHQSTWSDPWTGKLRMRIHAFKPSLIFLQNSKDLFHDVPRCSLFSTCLERGDSYLSSGRAKIQKFRWACLNHWITLSGFSRQSQHRDSTALGKGNTSFLLKHEIRSWAQAPAPKEHFASSLARGWEC